MAILADLLLVTAGVLVIALRDRQTLAISISVVPMALVLVRLAAGIDAHGLPGLLAPLVAGETAAAVLALGAGARPAPRRLSSSDGSSARETLKDLSPFSLLSAGMLALGAHYFAGLNPIIGPTATFPAFWLLGAGLYAALVATDLFKVGTGFLLIATALGLAIASVEFVDSIALGAGAVFTICFALVVAYLVQVSDAAGVGEKAP